MKICIFGDARSIHVQRLAIGLAEQRALVHVVTHKPCDIDGVTVERFQVPSPSITNPRRWPGRYARYLQGFFDRFDVVNVQFLQNWGFTPDMLERGCFVATAWGSDIVPPPGEGEPDQKLLDSRRMMLETAATVTACGPTFARMVAEFAGLNVSDVAVVPFGVDLERFSVARKPHATGAGPQCVGFFKGFRPVYGATFLIHAMPRILGAWPNTIFEMVGDGADLAECQALASRLGVADAVIWTPRQPHRSIPSLLARWDISVIPSVFEAFGVAALESSASGVPVVASNVGGLRDTVRHEQTGLHVTPGDPEALADAVIRLLGEDATRRRMGRAGRVMVEKEFEVKAVHAQWMSLFEEAVARVPNRSRDRKGAVLGKPGKRQALEEPLPYGRGSDSARSESQSVLMISAAFPPTGGPGVQRSAKFAKFLPRFGWRPIVWALERMPGMPLDPTLADDLPVELIVHRIGTRSSSILAAVDSYFGQTVRSLFTGRPLRAPWPDQQTTWAKHSLPGVLGVIKREGIDVIYSTFSPPSNHVLGLALKRHTGLPWVADFRDLWTDDYRYAQPSGARRKADRALEQTILETADVVIGVTPRQTAILADHMPGRREKFHTITNGFDPEDFEAIERRRVQPVKRGSSELRFTLAHVGRLDQYRASAAFFDGLAAFVDSLGEQRGRFMLEIVGHAGQAAREQLGRLGIPHECRGYVDHRAAIEAMLSADALLLMAPDGPNADSVIPAKLFEYLAARCPILVVGPYGGEAERIVRQTGAGVTARFHSNEVGAALQTLFDEWRDGEPFIGCSTRSLAAFSRETTAGQLADTLNSLTRRSRDGDLLIGSNLECIAT